jgi:hypothetical protein
MLGRDQGPGKHLACTYLQLAEADVGKVAEIGGESHAEGVDLDPQRLEA